MRSLCGLIVFAGELSKVSGNIFGAEYYHQATYSGARVLEANNYFYGRRYVQWACGAVD
jgi:hypothetical protein